MVRDLRRRSAGSVPGGGTGGTDPVAPEEPRIGTRAGRSTAAGGWSEGSPVVPSFGRPTVGATRGRMMRQNPCQYLHHRSCARCQRPRAGPPSVRADGDARAAHPAAASSPPVPNPRRSRVSAQPRRRCAHGTGAVDPAGRSGTRSSWRRGHAVPGRQGPAGDQPGRGSDRDPVAGGRADPASRLSPRRHPGPAQGAVPGHGADPAVRPGGQRPATAGAAVDLGAAAGPGGRPDRGGPGPAAPGHGLPVVPRARHRLVPRRRSHRAARHLPRHRPVRLEPEGDPVPHLHDRDRQPGAQRHRIRHGPEVRRRRRGRSERGGHHLLLRRRRHVAGRHPRGNGVRGRLRRPGRLLLPEQPVGDLRAGREAEQGAAVPPRQGIRIPRRTGGRQRRAGLPGRDPLGAWTSAAPATARC